MKRTRMLLTALTMIALWSTGCTDESDPGEGTLTVELWGEEYIEEGLPESEFADGFGIVFSKFLINLSAISVAQDGGIDAISIDDVRVYDLTVAGPTTLLTQTAPAGDYTHTAYTIAPATAQSEAGNATEADLEFMVANGYSVYAVGSATDGTDTFTFAWGFDTATVYDPCHSIGALDDGGETAVQITIHGDHLFYDSAVSTDPSLRFVDIALSDADGDMDITAQELAAYDLGPLAHYGVGSLHIDNLWDFISHMTTTLGHIDGEGHCEMQ